MIDLDYLESCLKGSTPAPWRADPSDPGDVVIWSVNAELIGNVGGLVTVVGEVCVDDEANAKLIVAMRNNLTELCRLARLGAAVEAMPNNTILRRMISDESPEWDYLGAGSRPTLTATE